jgi:hypothetical protein
MENVIVASHFAFYTENAASQIVKVTLYSRLA